MQSGNLRPEFLPLKLAFEHSGVPIAIFDRSLTLIFANQSLTEIYPDASSPLFALKIFGGSDVETVLNYLKSENRYSVVCKLDGETDTQLSVDAIFSSDGREVIGAFIIFAEKEKSVDFLSNSECMMAVNREFRDRLSMMFTSIYGISNSKTLNPDARDCEYINSINQNCYQLLRVSDNLSRFLSLTSESDCTDFSLINLVGFMRKLYSTIALMSNKNRVPINFKCSQASIEVKADLSRLEFAIVNIILNSLKYTKDGNVIDIELSQIGSRAVITISDKGAGMPKAVLARAGEPYFSYSHGERFEAGFGIGLYIAKKYIASNGGFFAINSQENIGTTVTISLPIDDGSNDVGVILNSPPKFDPEHKFSQTSVQLSEVCYYPVI